MADDQAPLPPLFLAARALQRYRAGHETFEATRHTLRYHAAHSHSRAEYEAILALIADLRASHARHQARVQRNADQTQAQLAVIGLQFLHLALRWPRLTAALLQPPAPPAPAPSRPAPPAPTPSTPTRTESLLLSLAPTTPARPIHRRTDLDSHARQQLDRTAERQARAHAERWYQALRQWRPISRPGDKVEKLTVSSGGGNMVAVTGNWASAPRYLDRCTIDTPIGEKNAQDLAALCNADPTLSDIRAGVTLATLSDPRGGWNRYKQSAVQYAHVVLCLAFYLGDPHAQEHLRHLPPVKN